MIERYSASSLEQEIAALLEQMDGYLHSLAWHVVPRQALAVETVDLDVEEIVQNTRIKLWQALKREQQIVNIRAYARTIVRNESINMARARKRLEPLQTDEQGELNGEYHPFFDNVDDESVQDPACVLEQAELLAEVTARAARAILQLPPRQRLAVTCALHERIDDVRPLSTLLQAHHIDVAATSWPEDRVEEHRLKSLLSISRGKLRRTLHPGRASHG